MKKFTEGGPPFQAIMEEEQEQSKRQNGGGYDH